jgi:hypothetical protein
MSMYYDKAPRSRKSLACPECPEPLRLKGRDCRFRCANGHSYPIEALLVVKGRRFEALGWTLPTRERLVIDLLSATPRGGAFPQQHEISPPVVAKDGRPRRLSARRHRLRKRLRLSTMS